MSDYSGAWIADTPDALSLYFDTTEYPDGSTSNYNVTATRTVNPIVGYKLGSQDGKTL